MKPAEEKAIKSLGGRLERRAQLAYIRRHRHLGNPITPAQMEKWVLGRQARYDKKAGGL